MTASHDWAREVTQIQRVDREALAAGTYAMRSITVMVINTHPKVNSTTVVVLQGNTHT